MADDILNFGVPIEFDTGSNESGHKATKTAGKLTQRNEKTFDLQTAICLEEVHLLDLAKQEMSGRAVFDYQKPRGLCQQQPQTTDNTPVGGAKLIIKFDVRKQDYVAIMTTETKNQEEEVLERDRINFIAELQVLVNPYLNRIPLRTIHK